MLMRACSSLVLMLALVACGSEDELPNAPQLVTDVVELRFGQDVGELTYVGARTYNTLSVKNGGLEALTLTAVNKSGDGAFTFSLPAEDVLPLTLGARQQTFVEVVFAPTQVGTFTGTLTLVSNASPEGRVIQLSGKSVAAP